MKYSDDKILFVDDEELVLNGIQRQIGKKYKMFTAVSAQDGIKIIEKEGPFALVISDMHMPLMDGIKFLGIIKDRFPECIRVMLTGNADLDTAISAVNKGNIFRFIMKPCPTEVLEQVITASLDQFHLIKTERELLEKTLKGTIKILIDILSMANSVAFRKASRIKYFAGEIATRLNLKDVWCFEIAAMLSQIGCVTIPLSVIEKIYSNQSLSSDEKKMMQEYPKIGYKLISQIPRLEFIGEMILRQKDDCNMEVSFKQPQEEDLISVGAQILRVAIDFDIFLSRGFSKGRAINIMRELIGLSYNQTVMSVLKDIEIPVFEKRVETVEIKYLRKNMRVEEEIRTKKGVLLVTKGQVVNDTLKKLLENHLKQQDIKDEIMVSIEIVK